MPVLNVTTTKERMIQPNSGEGLNMVETLWILMLSNLNGNGVGLCLILGTGPSAVAVAQQDGQRRK